MWPLSFITQEQLVEHVRATIHKYGEKLDSYTLNKFNGNLVDPVKLIFDKNVYRLSWDKVVSNEIARQRDKANNNDIGYFHQKLFTYIDGCTIPDSGWDIVYRSAEGLCLPGGSTVHTVYVEMKNKHNTMNSAAAGKTYIKMQHQLLHDDDCACFLVEAIAKQSQNIQWNTTVDKQRVGHKLIRRVSIDQFYALVTGVEDAFYQICMVLPQVIQDVVHNSGHVATPQDTVLHELQAVAAEKNIQDEEMAIAMAVYMLGFGSYLGFCQS